MMITKQLFAAAAAIALAVPSAAATQQSSPSFTWGEEVPDGPFAQKRQKETLAAQILLARLNHSPGVIDGFPGGNTARAISTFEEMQGLSADGKVDKEMLAALKSAAGNAPLLKTYTITSEDIGDGFTKPAQGMKAQAQTGKVGYGSASEMLAEKFGMSERFLKRLNPNTDFNAGSNILVANVDAGPIGDVARIEVDASSNELRAYDDGGTLLASFPATVGSAEFPSPSGTREVSAIAPAASYYFDPSDQDWGGDEKLTIPAGPNNPIGGVWIDLGSDGYGIHGSPDPARIGKTASHGCVRLTNFDVRRLLDAVDQGVTVKFV